jgi:hypothetical protein
MTFDIAAHHARLHDHMRRIAPHAQLRDLRWPQGPILRSQPEFRVVQVSPTEHGGVWVYITSGAASRHTPDGHLEFFIISPVDDVIHLETLATVTNFALDPRYQVRLGSILDIGRPWLPTSRCDHLLVSLPYPYGPTLEELGPATRILWLLPITREEAAFGREHGIEALEQCFEREQVEYDDPRRRTVRLSI